MALNYLKFSQISAFIVMFSVLYSPAALCSLLRVENKISYDRGLPVVQGYAGNKHFQIVIDTGSDEMMLSLDILKQWGIKTPHTQKFKDIEGKEYASEVWNIPALKLFNDNIRNIKTLVDTKFGLQASDEKFEDKKKGSLGTGILTGKRLSLDFKKNSAVFLDILDSELTQKSWIPFQLTGNGIELSLQIEDQSFKAILDTGSTVSFIKPTAIQWNWKKKRQGHEALKKAGIHHFYQPIQYDKIWQPSTKTPWRLYILDFTPCVDMIVGMDVLRGKRIILDFVNKKFLIIP